MTKSKVYTNKLTDAFHQELNIGDLVLGAKTKKGNYGDTQFIHAIVVGRTDAMVRLHQVPSENLRDLQELLRTIERRGFQGGKILPREVVLVASGHIPENQVVDTLEKGIQSLHKQNIGFGVPSIPPLSVTVTQPTPHLNP